MPVIAAGSSIVSYQAKRLTDGSSDLYCVIQSRTATRDNVFYTVSYHRIGDPVGQYLWYADIPWGGLWSGQMIKFASRPAPTTGTPYPAAVQTVDKIKVTTINITDDTDTAEETITTPTNLATSRLTPSNFTYVCYGDLGDKYGYLNIEWQDLSKFVNGLSFTLTKFGVTSPTVKQTIWKWSGATYGSVPNFTQAKFTLIPPGIQLDNPPDWPPDEADMPALGPNDAPPAEWVSEGDMLTLTIEIKTDDPHNYPATSITKNFKYYRRCRFYEIVDSATVGQPYSVQLEVIQDPWGGVPMVGTFTLIGAFPPPGPDTGSGGWTLTTAGLLTCIPGPTVANPDPGYTIQIKCTSKGNGLSAEPVKLRVNIVGTPKIKSPAHTMNLIKGMPYSHAYDLYATNNPNFFTKVSGTMPNNLFVDYDGTVTGVPGTIYGTPDTPTPAPLVTVFTATNSTATPDLVSDPYTITWTVIDFDTPTITSENTMVVYRGRNNLYQIEADAPVQYFKVTNLPPGLVLLSPTSGVISGVVKADVPLQAFQVGIRAANQWGWGEAFTLTMTVKIPKPVITSPPEATALRNVYFDYPIEATNEPTSYTATDLPPTLKLNKTSGHITGTPTTITDADGIAVTLTAINSGGESAPKILTLKVIKPDAPVIATDLIVGHALTGETGKYFTYKFSAFPTPTSWDVSGMPEGLSQTMETDKSLTIAGTFKAAGLYQLTLVAKNSDDADGASEPATVWLLVSESKEEAASVNQLGSVVEIWINMATAGVTVGNALTPEVGTHGEPKPPTSASMTIKRGDTTDVQVVFYDTKESGAVPADITLKSLKFGIKTSYDEEFVVFSERFTAITDEDKQGYFRIYPDFSGTNDDLDAILVTPSTALLAEIQWEMELDDLSVVRRSSQVFTINILRDLIHPD